MNVNNLIQANNIQKASLADMVLAMGEKASLQENIHSIWTKIRYIRQLQKLFNSELQKVSPREDVLLGCVNYINFLLGTYKRSGISAYVDYVILNNIGAIYPNSFYDAPKFTDLRDVEPNSFAGLKGYTFVVNETEQKLIPKKLPENPAGGQPILVWNETDAAAGEYDKDTFVSHIGKIWKSKVDNNTVEPSLDGGGESEEDAYWEAQSVEDFQESVLTKDIPITNPNLGSQLLGEVLTIGMSFTEFAERIVQITQYPTLIAPTFSLANNAGTREPGETFNITVTFTFNRGNIQGANVGGVWNPSASQGQRAGAATEYTIDGTSTGTTNSRTYSKTAVLGTNTIQATVSYAEGPQPHNSVDGIKDANGNDMTPLAAGTSPTQSTTFQAILKTFFGPVSAAPEDSDDVRALPSNNFSNTNVFTLNTGSTHKIFAFAIPSSKNIVSVIDLDALNANITSSYIVTTFNVKDAGGTDRSYKIAVMENAIPYDINHRHQITLS